MPCTCGIVVALVATTSLCEQRKEVVQGRGVQDEVKDFEAVCYTDGKVQAHHIQQELNNMKGRHAKRGPQVEHALPQREDKDPFWFRNIHTEHVL